jgi:hypothetical protein
MVESILTMQNILEKLRMITQKIQERVKLQLIQVIPLI